MPFESEKQRRYMWAKYPDIAKKWSKKEKENKYKNGGIMGWFGKKKGDIGAKKGSIREKSIKERMKDSGDKEETATEKMVREANEANAAKAARKKSLMEKFGFKDGGVVKDWKIEDLIEDKKKKEEKEEEKFKKIKALFKK